jgi:hypothetical protein
MAERSSRELRTLLRGGDDIYQVKKVLGQSNIQGPNLRTAPARLDTKNLQKTSSKNLRWANKAKNRSWEAEEIRENVVSGCAACSLAQLVELT